MKLKISPDEINERKPIWVALSEFYLGTELTPDDFKIIAKTFRQSKFSLDEIRHIDKYEVFPVLQTNLLNIAGEWAMFPENWLIEKITKRIRKRNWFNKIMINIFHWKFRWMLDDKWEKVTEEYKKLPPTSIK